MMPSLGKMLIILGAVIMLVGVVLLLANKIPFIGRLPGDILIKRENFTFYFPIMTCIIISIVLTLIFWILRK
jgi:heme/copper-type cytochrome/quinol oxidase subunit 2